MYAWTAAQAEMSDTVRPLKRDQVKPYYQEWVRRLGIGGRGRIYTATVRFLSYFTAAIHLTWIFHKLALYQFPAWGQPLGGRT